MLVTCPSCGAHEHRREAEMVGKPVFCCAQCGCFWQQAVFGLPQPLAELPPGTTPEMIARDQQAPAALPAAPDVMDLWLDRPDRPMTAASPARETEEPLELEHLVKAPRPARAKPVDALRVEAQVPAAIADDDSEAGAISWSGEDGMQATAPQTMKAKDHAAPMAQPEQSDPPRIKEKPEAEIPPAVSIARLCQAGLVLALGCGLMAWVVAAKPVFWPLGLTTLALFIVSYQTLIRNQLDSGPGPALRLLLQSGISLVLAYTAKQAHLPVELAKLAPIQGYIALLFVALSVLWGLAALWAARGIRLVFNWRLPTLLGGLLLVQYMLHGASLVVPSAAGLTVFVIAFGSLIGGAIGFGWATDPGHAAQRLRPHHA